jgi:lipoprotein signal peptidase
VTSRGLSAPAFGGIAFVWALALDLATKAFFVSQARHLGVYLLYNARSVEMTHRLLMCAVAVGAVVVLARLAEWRGLGRLPGAWIGVGLLAGGIVGNGVSPALWVYGVPDFISMPGGWVWNVADFEIGLGLVGGLGSIAVGAALTYLRERGL